MIKNPLQAPVHLRHYSLRQQPQKQQGGNKIKFVNPNVDNYDRNIRHSASLGLPCYEKDFLKGKTAIVCGSGPSLTHPDTLKGIDEWIEKGAILVACKKAIKVLYDLGYKVDWAVSMDPGDHIACPERIFKAPGVKHLIASTSDPALFEYLKDEDVTIFHSATGYINEVPLYKELFNNADVMGGGFNVVNRAVAAFIYMGCEPLILAGTDCGWRENETFYADGTPNRPGVDMSDQGVIDGTPWHTRPDMLASGVALAKLAKKQGDNMIILGDVLPAKLRLKDDEFLNKVASFH